MSRKVLWLSIFIFSLFTLTACSRTEDKLPVVPTTSSTETPKASPNDGPPADVVRASVPQVELTTGTSAEALVTVKIATGFHINGNPSSKYQIATALSVDPKGGVTAGNATYPPSATKTFSFSPDPIKVYEGEVVIKQPLRAEPGATKGNQTLQAKLKVQPCDDNVCYPPRTLEVSIPINVK